MLQEHLRPLSVETQDSTLINQSYCVQLLMLTVQIASELRSANSAIADTFRSHMYQAIEEARENQELSLPEQIRAFTLARLIHWALNNTAILAVLHRYYDAIPTITKPAIIKVICKGLGQGILEASHLSH